MGRPVTDGGRGEGGSEPEEQEEEEGPPEPGEQAGDPEPEESRAVEALGRAGVSGRAKYYVIAYPLATLVVLFLVPLSMLFVFSFYVNIVGGGYQAGFTLHNYARMFGLTGSTLYLDRLRFTLEISLLTTALTLVLGYPLAYYLARVSRPMVRRLSMVTIVSTLWVTYVIRGYAWTVLLSRDGVVSEFGQTVGLLAEPTSFAPSYEALLVSMVYVFLPFMVLTLYNSISQIDPRLEEASKNLGAGPIETVRRVTLPLSKNGVLAGSVLVFILSLGVYVLPRILGNPRHYTLPVFIGQQVANESNVPFGAAMSVVLVVVVAAILLVTVRVTGVSAAGLGGEHR